MESEDKLAAIVLVALILAFTACAITAMLTDSGEQQPRTEREERVGWACWHEEWADTRESQRRYLEQRHAR